MWVELQEGYLRSSPEQPRLGLLCPATLFSAPQGQTGPSQRSRMRLLGTISMQH